MQLHIKSDISSRAKQLQAEFLALIQDEVGEGVFKDCGKEQFQQLEAQGGGQEFYLQEEEESTGPSIKTAPFHKFMNMGIQKEKKEHGELDELTVETYNFAYGCNDGKTIQMVEGKLCKAIGVNIFFDGFIFPCQADRNDLNYHSYQICYLSYDSNCQLLYSGSNGKNSEIIQWKYCKVKPYLSFVRKVTLPSSTLGVNFTFKLNKQLFCVSKWSLHKQSELFSFDVETTKRTRYELPLGKVMGLCVSLNVYLINQKGLQMLSQNEKGFELIKITQSEKFATTIGKVGSEYLLVGMLDGSVEIVCPNHKTLKSRVGITNSPILAVKMIGNNRFVATNNAKQAIIFQMDAKYKNQKKIQSFKLSQISRNIRTNQNGFVCQLRGGKLQQFQLQDNQKVSKNTEKLQDYMNYGYTTQQFGQIICYNKQANKYIYSSKGRENLVIFQLNKNNTIQKLSKALVTNPLSYFDSQGTIVACIGVIKKKYSTETLKQTLQFYDFMANKSICMVEQLPFKDCTCIKFNQDGDKLALGFSNGKMAIFNTNNLKSVKEICRTQQQKAKDFNHDTPLQNIIWSRDGRYLRGLSQNNLLFYGIKNINDAYELVLYDGKKGDKQAMKNADWTQMGKFNWRAAKIWSRANSVQQYTDIVQSGGYLFASLDTGDMQAFANPADQEYFALFRWFTCGYRMKLVENVEGSAVLIAGRGSLICANIK